MPANAITSPFSHPYRPAAGSAAEPDTDSAADEPREENPMPKTTAPAAKKPRKPKTTKAASAQFQICSLLMAKGDMTQHELKADVSADPKAFYNAIFNGKAAGRIVYLEKTEKYHLTQAGREWTTGGANLDNHKASAPPPKATKRAPAKKAKPARAAAVKPAKKARKARAAAAAAQAAPQTTALTLGTFEPVVERSFKCAAFSDGSFMLAKNGQVIELTPAEHAEMIRYEERMAEVPA